ncbi:hypothetical protein GCM10010442_72550 [Kitasatospora kifunensis]
MMVTGPEAAPDEPEPLLPQAASDTVRAATRAKAALPRRMRTPRRKKVVGVGCPGGTTGAHTGPLTPTALGVGTGL